MPLASTVQHLSPIRIWNSPPVNGATCNDEGRAHVVAIGMPTRLSAPIYLNTRPHEAAIDFFFHKFVQRLRDIKKLVRDVGNVRHHAMVFGIAA